MKLSEHFDSSEFRCNCGKEGIQTELVKRLETLFAACQASCIIISSGYRCPDCSVAVGGYRNDMHTKGGAADLIVYRNGDNGGRGEPMSSFAVCAIAEDLGLFNGIAVIDDNYVHLDIRGVIPYSNNHWFGNEATGENYSTFKSYLPSWYKGKAAEQPHKIKVYYDDKLLIEKDFTI